MAPQEQDGISFTRSIQRHQPKKGLSPLVLSALYQSSHPDLFMFQCLLCTLPVFLQLGNLVKLSLCDAFRSAFFFFSVEVKVVHRVCVHRVLDPYGKLCESDCIFTQSPNQAQ